VTLDRIALTSSDDGQQFGLPAPVDAERDARLLLLGKHVVSGTIAKFTGDLSLVFADGTTLQLVQDSSGYEAWQAIENTGGGRFTIIALGGGKIAVSQE
jgi:hypothetical protein